MSGKAVAQPAIPLMKSRRRIAGSLPRYADDGFQRRDYSRDLRSAEWGSMINLRCKSLRHRCPLWVRSGHGAIKLRCPLYPPKQTLLTVTGMSVWLSLPEPHCRGRYLGPYEWKYTVSGRRMKGRFGA